MSKTNRPSRDEYFLQMAELVATRSTCIRRSVGAVAVNERGHVMATGYNGVPSGMTHCNEVGGACCQGATSPSGTDLDGCLAVHAEVNLLAQCSDVWKIHTVYATVSPCFGCVKALMSSSCRRLVFRSEYPHPAAKAMWIGSGREWVEMPRGR